MRKLVVFFVLLLISLTSGANFSYAECNPATGFPLSCSSGTRCPIGRPGGGGPGQLLCCDTSSECNALQSQAGMPQAVNQAVSQVSTICDSVSDPGACNGCMADGNHVWTAIGCIDTQSPTGLMERLLGIGIGIAGGIAFLLILFGGMQILTSAGNPEQLNAGRELVSAAIIGLILVIFAIFLLRFIGVNIIGIPEFGSSGPPAGPGR